MTSKEWNPQASSVATMATNRMDYEQKDIDTLGQVREGELPIEKDRRENKRSGVLVNFKVT